MSNVHSPTWTGTSLPPGVVLGQVRAFPAQGTDKTSTTNLPPDVGEPGLLAMMCLNDSGSTIGASKVVCRKAATVTARITLCSAMPRATTGDAGVSEDMPSYMARSMSQKAMVLSPTSAWSWLSAYAMLRSE